MELLNQTVAKNYLMKLVQKLSDIDFYPFKFSKAKLAMTAHILFTNLDRDHPATHSKK